MGLAPTATWTQPIGSWDSEKLVEKVAPLQLRNADGGEDAVSADTGWMWTNMYACNVGNVMS